MYSILMSKFEIAYPIIKEELRKIIFPNSKVLIIPWSFASELETKDIYEFFNERRRKKYIDPLLDLGIDINNISVLDCYKDNYSKMEQEISRADVILLTGGNPEMLYNKIKEAGIMDLLKKFNGTIMGASAGAELQLKKYFITAKNNYYKKFDWYDGIGIIDNDFYFDVHSVRKGRYISSLKQKSSNLNKTIYCLFDDGIIFYNRKTKEIKCIGNVEKLN